MTVKKGSSPEEYAGAIQHFDEIPERYRLETYAGQYRGDNTWRRYVDEVLLEEYDSDRIRQTARLGGESWLEHMADRARHHALATPEDVNEWCEMHLEERARKTIYEYYFLRVYDFYDHLKHSHQHPHLYNPFLLAAIDYEATRYVWLFRIDRRREKQEKRTNE